MVSDLDINRSANELIKRYGDKAWAEAVERYFDLKQQGDTEGMNVWRRIAAVLSDYTHPIRGNN